MADPLPLRGLQDEDRGVPANATNAVVVHMSPAYADSGAEISGLSAVGLIWAVAGGIILFGRRRRA